MTPTELVARFEELLSRATPAPWHWTGSGDSYVRLPIGDEHYEYEGEMHSPHVCDEETGWPNCRQDDYHFASPVMVCETDGGAYVHNDVDFQLWEFARNELPSLLAYVRELERVAAKPGSQTEGSCVAAQPGSITEAR
jgi:hypothetical protein